MAMPVSTDRPRSTLASWPNRSRTRSPTRRPSVTTYAAFAAGSGGTSACGPPVRVLTGRGWRCPRWWSPRACRVTWWGCW